MSDTLREWLAEAPYTLCMSSGFFGFFAHCGMLSVLESEGLWPSRVVGSSAGGLVAGAWASGLSASALEAELRALKRTDFWDPRPGFGLLRGRKFQKKLEALLPVHRFEGCRVEVAVSAYDVLSRSTKVIGDGDLVAAIRATAALPVLFQPVWVRRRPMMDGGILDRPGHAALARGERTLFHHLVSRSPWRRADSPALAIPRGRPGMVTLGIGGLPRVNPFALHRGREAMTMAADATRRALDRPIVGAAIEVAAATRAAAA